MDSGRDLYFEEQNKGYVNILNNVRLLYCGKEQCNPGYSFGHTIREEYLIHIVLSGKGVFRHGDKEEYVKEGNAFLIYPGEENSYCADENFPWTYIWVGFTGNRVEKLLEQIGFTKTQRIITLDDTSSIVNQMNGILVSQGANMVDELKRQSCFYSVLASLIEFSQDCPNVNKEDERIESLYVSKAIELISKNYNKKLKVQDIASYIGINRSYLTNLFKKNIGVSPQNYLIDYRLEKSSQLLKETQSSMVDIALEVGYSDSLAFSKAFKQKYGISPSQFRKKNNV